LLVKIHVSEKELLALKDRWDQLIETHPHKGIWLTFDWFYTWWQNKRESFEPYVISVEKEDTLMAIMPLVKEKSRFWSLPLNRLQFVAGDHPNEILVGNRDIDNCLQACADFLRHHRRDWDQIFLRFLSLESGTVEKFLALLDGSKIPYIFETGNASPYILADNNWEAYDDSLSTKFKRNIRNIQRKMQKLGTSEVVSFNKPEQVKTGLGEIFEIAEKSWQGQIEKAISSDRDRVFFSEFAKAAAHKNWLDLRVLKLNGIPIAFCYNIVFSDIFFGLKTGYDPEYRNFSPGTILLYETFHDLIEKGVKELNLMGTHSFFKARWTDLVRQHYDITIFRKQPRFLSQYIKRKWLYKWLKQFSIIRKMKQFLKHK